MLIPAPHSFGWRQFKILIVCLLVFSNTLGDHQTGTNTENSSADNRQYINPLLNKGVLLIAAEKLLDPNFEKTVILITRYNEDGTSGLVLNRPVSSPIEHTLPHILDILPELEHIYFGGPVLPGAISLLVASESTLLQKNKVIQNIYLIDNMELFKDIVSSNLDREHIRLFSGFAGWAPGQLESELMRGDWYLWHASKDIIFSSSPEQIWDELIRLVTAKWAWYQTSR